MVIALSERWSSYIKEGLANAGNPVVFALTQWSFLFPVFLAICRSVPRGGRVLDAGCGAGIFTALLAHHGFEVTGVDQDPEIVAIARDMAEYFRSAATIETADVFDLSRFHGRFDLVFSLGVVEHFEPETTVRLLQEQARCASVVLAAVPTRFTRYASPVTDERLYRRGQMCRLMSEAGLQVRESFVYGDVPTRAARNLERLLPGAAHRIVRNWFTYGMGICCVGVRQASPAGAA